MEPISMEEEQLKLHSMIISSGSQKTAVEVYKFATAKYNFSAIRTMDDAMINSCPSLAEIKNKLSSKGDPGQLDKMLKYMVAMMAKAFNFSKNIEPSQIDDVIVLIQRDFNYFKLSEVFFILENIRMGRTGAMYERLDVPTIIHRFDDYAIKRMEKAEQIALMEHDRYTSGEKSRKYDNFIQRLENEQNKEKSQEVKDMAYNIAKKMVKSSENKNQQSHQTQQSK